MITKTVKYFKYLVNLIHRMCVFVSVKHLLSTVTQFGILDLNHRTLKIPSGEYFRFEQVHIEKSKINHFRSESMMNRAF